MPVDRPTFSESWYRVADLRPRLRSTVQVHRQHFRGRMWHVLQDPGSNQFFRLNEPAYAFVALLDGHRRVGDVWHACNEQLGDDAPTQGEVIQLLGQLYVSNLLQGDLPPDAEAMFTRYRKRIRREIQGYLTNLLFVRLPLLDPDHFLNRWAGVFGRVFSVPGFILWLAIIATGAYFIIDSAGDLVSASAGILNPANLPLLYLSIVFVKVFHEFGHAFACKRFGQKGGTGGEVHVMGVMFLIFTPLPYVDASSAWAFRSKWHRVIVGLAGMMVELAIAAVACIVWASTDGGAAIHQVAYNVMFIASVSTLLFNGNPLLRYDAYYIFSDLIEIPNLWNRSRQFLYYLVKKFIWGVKRLRNPAHTPGEKGWMFVYAIASTIYRLFILVVILLFLTKRLPADLIFIALLFAVMGFIAMFVVPAWKFVHYLATSTELMRVRPRAVISTAIVIGALIAGVGIWPAPDHPRVEGVVEPVQLAVIHVGVDGFVMEIDGYLRSGAAVGPERPVLVRQESPELVARRRQLVAEREGLIYRRRLEQTREIAAAQAIARHIIAVDRQIELLDEDNAALTVRPPEGVTGTWVSPDIERIDGVFLGRGQQVGLVASLDKVIIRAVADQEVPVDEAIDRVEMRVKGRPELHFNGTITRRLRAGQETLPSAALGYLAGGELAVSPEDPEGRKAAEQFFVLLITPDAGTDVRLLIGQRVVVRLEMERKPYLVQWWRKFQRLVQKRVVL